MNQKEFSPEESIQLINSVIQEARYRFVENGHIYLFWGSLLFVLSLAQFLLIQNGYRAISYYPYFVIPFGFLYSALYYGRGKKERRTNRISKLVNGLWIIIGINLMIIGFFFSMVLGPSLIPIILILSGIGISISGFAIQDKNVIYSGILSNIVGISCFMIAVDYQPLVFAITVLFSYVLPGFWLRQKFKKQHEV